MRQFRLVHLGLTAALAAAAVAGVGFVRAAGASESGTASVLIPITPCRLFDTRAGTDSVGSRATPIGGGESATFAVWGTNGNCTIPPTATGIVANATAANPTIASYVTFFPADAAPRPTASNLNFVADAPPTPNQITVGLSAAGAIGVFNNGGTVDLIVDVVGYYQASTGGGATGPAGAPGPAGTPGAPGPSCPITGCVAFYSGDDAANHASSLVPDPLHAITLDRCLELTPDGFSDVALDLPGGAAVDSVRIRYSDDVPGAASRTQYSLVVYDEAGYNTANESPEVATTDGAGQAQLALANGRPVQGRSTQYSIYINIYGTGQKFCGAEVSYHF